MKDRLRHSWETLQSDLDSGLTPFLKWGSFAAFLFVAFFFTTSLYIAAHRLFWFDEVMTMLISRMPDTAALVKLLKSGVDQQPLTYYLVVRFFDRLFGPGEMAARLPSALGLAAGLLITFDCARRLTDHLHGLLAPALLTCSSLPYYGFEARPYGLYFMWSACSLWLWMHTRQESRAAAVLFGLATSACIATQYYAVFCLIPYTAIVALEAKQVWHSQKLLAAFGAASVTLALFAPLAFTLRQFSNSFWAEPTIGALSAVYSLSFPRVLFPLAITAIWMVLLTRRRYSKNVPAMVSSERLAWFFLLIPLGGFIAAKLVTNAFHPRYFIGMLPGIAVGFSCLMWRQFRGATLMSLGAVCIIGGYGMSESLYQARHAETIQPVTAPGEADRLRKMLQIESTLFDHERKQFIVLMSGDLLAPEVFFYSRHPEKYAFLPSLEPSSMALGLANLSRVYPIHFWNLDEIKKHASQAALIDPPAAILGLLGHEAISVHSFRFDHPLTVVFLK